MRLYVCACSGHDAFVCVAPDALEVRILVPGVYMGGEGKGVGK